MFCLPAIVVVAANSCSKTEIGQIDEGLVRGPELVPLSLSACVVETKTSLEGKSITFSVGDKINVFDETEYTAIYESFQTTAGGESAKFEGLVDISAKEFFALYPYNEAAQSSWNYEKKTVITTLPSEQTSTFGDYNINAAIAKDNSFVFNNVLSIVKFTIPQELDGEVLSVGLSVDGACIAGDVVVDYSGQIPVAYAVDSEDSNNESVVTLTNENEEALKSGTYYLNLIPVLTGTPSITFYVMNTEKMVAEIEASLTKPFSPGTIKNLGTIPEDIFNSGPGGYERVNSLEEVVDGNYVIVGAKSDKSFGAFAYSSLNSGRTTFNHSYEYVPALILEADDEEIWKATVSGSGDTRTVIFYNEANKKTLYCNNSNGQISWSSGIDELTLTHNNSENNFSLYTTADYYLGVNKDSNYWRFYKATNLYESGKGLYLYKESLGLSKTVMSIKLSGSYKTTFAVGGEFDYKGLVVTAVYHDGSTAVVEPTSVSTPDLSAEGQQIVTVTYEEGMTKVFATYEVSIVSELPEEPEHFTSSFDFSAQGYGNGDDITEVSFDDITIVFDKGTNKSNSPKYYTTGTAVRVYYGNSFIVTAKEKTITAIAFVYDNGENNNEIVADPGTFTSPNWTGSAQSILFTIEGTSGHRRIKTITVEYE